MRPWRQGLASVGERRVGVDGERDASATLVGVLRRHAAERGEHVAIADAKHEEKALRRKQLIRSLVAVIVVIILWRWLRRL